MIYEVVMYFYYILHNNKMRIYLYLYKAVGFHYWCTCQMPSIPIPNCLLSKYIYPLNVRETRQSPVTTIIRRRHGIQVRQLWETGL